MSGNVFSAGESIASGSRLIHTANVDVAVTALMLHEYSITFASEVKYIWSARWNAPKVLYFITKYLALISQIIQINYSVRFNVSSESCVTLVRLQSALTYIVFVVTEALLLLRTSAMYKTRRAVFPALALLYFASMIAGIIVLAMWTTKIHFQLAPSPKLIPGCSFSHGNPVILIAFAILAAWEFTIFILASAKGWMEHTSTGASLLKIFYKDGFQFYIYSACVTIINIVVLFAASPEYIGLILSLERSAHAICATRLLLHVRSVSQHTSNDTEDVALRSLNLAPNVLQPPPEDDLLYIEPGDMKLGGTVSTSKRYKRSRKRLSTVVEMRGESETSLSVEDSEPGHLSYYQ